MPDSPISALTQVSLKLTMLLPAVDMTAPLGLKNVSFTVQEMVSYVAANIPEASGASLGLAGADGSTILVTEGIFSVAEGIVAGAAAGAAAVPAAGGNASAKVVGGPFGTVKPTLQDVAAATPSVLFAGVAAGSDAASPIEDADSAASAAGYAETYFPGGTYEGDGSVALTNAAKTIWTGEGVVSNAVRRQVAKRHLISPSIWGSDIAPERHLTKFHATTTPVVVIMGDSIFNSAANLIAPTESPWWTLVNQLKVQNPASTITHYNRTIAGEDFVSMSGINGALPQSFPSWYTNQTSPWLSYVEALEPDLLILHSGGNDGPAFSVDAFWTLLNAIKGWAKVPDIIFGVTYQPSLSTTVNGYSTPAYINGVDLVAGYVRSFCRANDYGFFDFHRWHAMCRDGFDPTETALSQIILQSGSNYLNSFGQYVEGVPSYFFPANVNDNGVVAYACTDFYFQFFLYSQPPGAISIPLSGLTGGAQPNAFFLDLDNGGFVSYFWTDGFNNNIDATTTTIETPAFPSPGASLEIMLKGERLFVRLNGTQVICDLIVTRAGGPFQPVLSGIPTTQSVSVDNICISNSSAITDNNRRFKPVVTDFEIYEQLPQAGGSGSYHLNAYGWLKICTPVLNACNFSNGSQTSYENLVSQQFTISTPLPAPAESQGVATSGSLLLIGTVGASSSGRLTQNGQAATASNSIPVPASATMLLTIDIVVRGPNGGNSALLPGTPALVQNNAGVVSVLTAPTFAMSAGSTFGALSATLTADTVNNALNLTLDNAANGEPVDAVAMVRFASVQ